MKKIALAIFFLLFLPAFITAGYYFEDDFSTIDNTSWCTNFFMAREGRINLYPATYLTTIDATGTLNYTGIVYTSQFWDGAWGGTGVILSNVKYTASLQNPIGAELKITSWQIDNSGSSPSAEMADFGLWIVEDELSSVSLYTNEYQNFKTRVMVFYTAKNGNTPDNFWGTFVNGSDNKLNMQNAVRPDGSTIDLSSFNDLTVNVTGNELINTNISIKLSHTSDNILVYFNPNPKNSNNNGYPDEFCLVGNYPVAFNQNIRFYINEEVRNKNSYCNPKFDYFLIKSAVDSFTASIPGGQINASTNGADRKELDVTFANTIKSSPTNAGINVITITKPSSFSNWAESVLTNEIVVLTAYEGGATLKSNIIRPFAMYSNLGTNECAVKTNGDQLWIRLGKQVDDSFTTKTIKVIFKLKTASSEGDYTFYATVDAVLFDPVVNNQTNYSTCGQQQKSFIVEIVSGERTPYAFGAIEDDDGDNIIISGAPSYTFTYTVETIGVTNIDADTLNEVYIMIPQGFVISSAESLVLIDNNAVCVSFLTNADIGITNGNFIKIDYSLDTPPKKIAAQDGIDIMKIVVSQATQIGTFSWPCWVTGTLSGDKSKIKTNSSNPDQTISVIGANPNAWMTIYQPSAGDPRILFNTQKSNEIKIEIQNRATDPANKIQVAVLTIPAFFTNITGITSQRMTSANIKYGQAPIGNKSTITLFYANEGKNIPFNDAYDIITFNSFHNIPASSGTVTNEFFSVIVNNSNGAGYKPANTMGKVTNIMITDPEPSGSASIEPADSIVYTSDVTNVFQYQIVNTAPLSSDTIIKYVDIFIATNYFSKVTNVSSSLIGTTGITYDNKQILINYQTAGTNLIPGQLDTITFTMIDTYTNMPVPDDALITSSVRNDTFTNNTTDYSPKDRKVYFIPQEERVDCWTVTKSFLSEISTFTLYYSVSNYGDTGNKIDQARIYFTNTFINLAVGDITSQISGAVVSLLAGPVINIDYSSADFNSDMKDNIEIIGTYTATGQENTYYISSSVTVNTSYLAAVHVKTNDDVSLHFEIPFPTADVYINPNIIFASSTPQINYMNYIISNTGSGANKIMQAEILVPDIYLSKVSIVSSVFINNEAVSITNKSDKLIISYVADTSNLLNPGDMDTVTIVITNSVSGISNVDFNCRVHNYDKNQLTDIKSGWSKQVSIVQQASIAFTPHTNYTTDVTNKYNIRIVNGTVPGKGRNIYRARITINTQFFETSYINSYNHYAAAFVKNTNINNVYYRLIDYSANPLTPSNVDDFYLDIVDKVLSTNSLTWTIEVDYNDGYGFRTTRAQTNGADKLTFVIPDVEGTASISPNQIAIDNITTPMTYVINNNGSLGNEILVARINIPNSDTIFTNIITSTVSNLLGLTNITFSTVGGNGHICKIILNYEAEGKSIPANSSDYVYFTVYDSEESGGPTKYQFSCDAANTVDTNFTAPTSVVGLAEPVLDAQKVKFTTADFNSYAYISSHSPLIPIDTTTTTNTIQYYIYNSSFGADIIEQVRISIPTNYFVTNGIQVTNTTPNPNITISADSIIINYQAGSPPSPIAKGLSDTITIRIVDKVYVENISNVQFPISADFDTSSGYIPCDEPGGNQLQSVNFQMPEAEAEANITPNYTLTVNHNRQLSLDVVNKGSGSNKVFKVIVNVNNSIITNVYNVQSSLITTDNNNVKPAGIHTNNPAYAKNVSSFTLYYNRGGVSLNTSSTDTITFTTLDNYTNNMIDDNVLFSCLVANESNLSSTNFYTADIPIAKRMDVDLRHFPGYPYVNNNVEAGFVDTEPTYNTNVWGNYQYRIENNGPPGNNIEWAVINIPSGTFTNFYGIQSARISGTFIKSNTSSITLYYGKSGGAAPIPPGEADTISFIAAHNVSSTTNIDVSVEFPSFVKYQTNGTSFQAVNLNDIPLVQYVNIKRVTTDKALSYISSIVKVIHGYNAEVTVDTQAITYSMDTNIILKYKFVNQSADEDITTARITFSVPLSNLWFYVDHANASNSKGTVVKLESTNLSITFTTPLKSINGAATEDERMAIISIPIYYNVLSPTNIYVSGKYGLGVPPDTDTVYDSDSQTQKLQFSTITFGRIIGRTYPPDLTVTKQVVTTTIGNELKSIFNTTIPEIYSDSDGVYILDYIPVGTFNLKLLSEFPTTTVNNIPIVGGTNTTYFNNPHLFRDFHVCSYISSFTNYVGSLPVVGLYDTTAKSYTLDHNSVYIYTLQNRYTNRSITNVKFNFSGPLTGTWFTLLTNDISTKGTITNISSSNFEIYYNPALSGNEVDTITLPIYYNTSTAQNLEIAASYTPMANLNPYSVSDDNTQLISYNVPTFGRIIGKIYPPRLADSVNKQVLRQNGTVVNEAQEVYTSITNGEFILDYIPAGTYDFKFVTDEALSYTLNDFTVTAQNNMSYNTYPELIINLKFAVNPDEPGQQKVSILDNYYTNTSLTIPSGDSLTMGFKFNIKVNYLTSPERQEVTSGNSKIIKASFEQTESLVGFDFDLEDLSGNDLPAGVNLNSECILTIQYNKQTFPSTWDENKLCIYYWDDAVSRWYRLGGVVDTGKSIITTHIRYLHRRYAVMASKGNENNEDIYDVMVDNNPFTPDSSDPNYSHTIINFKLKETAEKLELKIFNLKGEEIIGYKLNGFYLNGQQSWDGKDMSGNPVDSGVYIFQVIADESKVYTGSILLIK